MASHCTYVPDGRHGPTTRILVYVTASHYVWAPCPDWHTREVGGVHSTLNFRSVRKMTLETRYCSFSPLCCFSYMHFVSICIVVVLYCFVMCVCVRVCVYVWVLSFPH